jgi:beta-glucosidase/6-phospho-beta-glucosidase/beta-galactosidase
MMMINDAEINIFHNVFKELHKQNMEPIFYFIKHVVPDSNKKKYEKACLKFNSLSKNRLRKYQKYIVGTHDTFFTNTNSKLETFFAFIIIYYASCLITK